jgi:hypothetical protein
MSNAVKYRQIVRALMHELPRRVMYVAIVEPCVFLSPSAVTLVNFSQSIWQETNVSFYFSSSLVHSCTLSCMNYQSVREL